MLATYTLKNDVLVLEEIDIYGSSRLGLLKPNLQMYPSVSVENKDFEGKKNYELSNHLGNVLAVISDRKRGMGSSSGNYAYFDAVTLTATDYYPFGMAMPGRAFNTEGYRYGFNGKENDSEWAKQDYGMRISDPRIGRFLSIDPLTAAYPFYSPYQFAGNMPIWAIDLDGLEPAFTNGGAEAREDNMRSPESRNKEMYGGNLMKEVEIKAQRVAGTPETWKRTNVRSLATGDISYNVDGVNIVQRNSITGSQYYATYKDAPTVKIWDDAEKKRQYWNNLVATHEVIGYGSASLCMEALTMGGGGIAMGSKAASGSRSYVRASAALTEATEAEVRASYIWRFDTRSPDEIMKIGGFKAWGDNMNVYKHVTGETIDNLTSGYVSTSRYKNAAIEFSQGEGGYLYKIKRTGSDLDINKLSKFNNWKFTTEEFEMAVPKGIPYKNVISVKKINR